ncbi:hypothetical protein NL676_002069 [Syzygium grande]|nr:hypothetical protein NL676_002069 [Syzygium grande]
MVSGGVRVYGQVAAGGGRGGAWRPGWLSAVSGSRVGTNGDGDSVRLGGDNSGYGRRRGTASGGGGGSR